LVAGEAANQALELQNRERRQDLRGGETRTDNQLVDPGGLAFKLA
jgi:hypothetical protein